MICLRRRGQGKKPVQDQCLVVLVPDVTPPVAPESHAQGSIVCEPLDGVRERLRVTGGHAQERALNSHNWLPGRAAATNGRPLAMMT